MKVAKLIHNPKAGDEEHGKKALIELIEHAGFECRYSSTKKKNWSQFEDDIDLVVVAGGDGTVKKITKELLDRKILEKSFPIALLPLGTANNIGSTLNIRGETEDLVAGWKNAHVKKMDVGICDINDDTFFLESFGFGIFPYLMAEMNKVDKDLTDTPEKKMDTALSLLLDILDGYEARACSLMVDDEDRSGDYILAEIMNICSIGPNLVLAPNADPGDGIMEVITIGAKDKDSLVRYVKSKLLNQSPDYIFPVIKANKVAITWQGTHVHLDDEILKIKESTPVNVTIKPGLLEFLVT